MSLARSTKRKRARDLRLTYKRTSRHIRRDNVRLMKILQRQRVCAQDIPYHADNTEVVLYLPKYICISEKNFRRRLINCIYQLHEACEAGAKKVILDFWEVEKIYADGMLVLYAEVRNILNLNKNVRFQVHCPPAKNAEGKLKRQKIKEVITQIGLYELIGQSSKAIPTQEDVIHWKYVCGTKANGEQLSKGGWEAFLQEETSEELYGRMIEAATNCTSHAYSYGNRPLSDVKHTKEAWWLFSQVKDARLSVLFCDLGIGIPKSLPQGKFSSIWRTIVSKKRLSWSDGEIIEESTKIGLTTTGANNRGHGLDSMVTMARETEGGRVIIYSNKGAYDISHDSQQQKIRDYDDSINGTLIYFSFPIKRGVEYEREDNQNR